MAEDTADTPGTPSGTPPTGMTSGANGETLAEHTTSTPGTPAGSSPDRGDPAEAGAAGLAYLDQVIEGDAGEEAAEQALRLLAFAADRAPDHPDAPLWRYRVGTALGRLARERDSVTDLDAAVAHLTAVAGDGATPPDLAEWAAVDAADLTATRLALAAEEEDLSPEEARRLTDALDALAPVVRDDEEALDFLLQRAHAHRWAYLSTLDPEHLEHVVAGMTTALRDLPPDDDERPDALEALSAAQAERHRLSGDPAPLEAAVEAATAMRSLLADDDDRLPGVRLWTARLRAVRFWTAAEKDDADRDAAIAEYAAEHAEAGLPGDYARDYGFLLCVRGDVTGNADDLRTAVDVLTDVAADPDAADWPLAGSLAEAHEALAGLDGPHHLWEAVDWSTRTLAHPAPEPDQALDVRTRRLVAVEAAAREFGIDAVLARYDVREVLADAEAAARDTPDASPQARARLATRAVLVRTQWPAECFPLGDADALRASVRSQVDLLNEIRTALPDEDRAAVDGLATVVDVMTHAFVGGPGSDAAGDPARSGVVADLAHVMDLFTSSQSSPHRAPGSPEDEVEADLTTLMRRLYELVGARGKPHELVGAFTDLVWRVDALPPSGRRDDMQAVLTALSWAFGQSGTAPSQAFAPRLGDDEGTALARLFALATDWRAALAEDDPRRALWAYQAVERAAAGFQPGTAADLTARMVRGTCRARLSAVVPTDPAALDAAIADLEAAWHRSAAWSAGTAGSAGTAVDLACRLRLRDRPGDRATSRELGLAALAAEGARVPLLSAEDALAVVAEAAVTGENVTAWCLDDGADDDLVRVLEARRELVLGAAVGRVAEPDAVAGPEEVRAALRAVDADVLAYLVPECAAHRGTAVLVPVEGPVRVVPLPLLTTEPVARYAAARAARHDAAPGSVAARAWRTALTDVCAWAWEAVGAELVRAAGDARVVLVPLGALGLVPWPAAWREVDGRRRYLVEDVEVSVTPSAGLLGRVAARPPAAGTAVFVGNPNRDDAAAAETAEALRDGFHPDGRFLGGHGQAPRPWRVSADGKGTPEEVRAAAAGGLSVLHLGCRATSEVTAPRRSQVALHGNAPLTAAELLAHGADVGVVTLADHTTLPGAHDVALTLPAAFLAAGARSVLAGHWPAPAAHLTYLVHHHVREHGSSPRAALRAAQLWMLDPDRVLPDTAPGHLERVEPTDFADPAHWAAFTHFGR